MFFFFFTETAEKWFKFALFNQKSLSKQLVLKTTYSSTPFFTFSMSFYCFHFKRSASIRPTRKKKQWLLQENFKLDISARGSLITQIKVSPAVSIGEGKNPVPQTFVKQNSKRGASISLLSVFWRQEKAQPQTEGRVS